MVSNSSSDAVKTYPFSDFPDEEDNREVSERAVRLRQAVKAAGGNQEVATRSGMNLSTLNRYIAGRDMKASAMVKLAAACNVSLDWLATGRGSMRPTDAPSEPDNPPRPAEPTKPDTRPLPGRSLKLFATVDIDRMAAAMETAQEAFARQGKRGSWRRFAQVAMLIYDETGEDEDAPDRDRTTGETTLSGQDIS